MITPRTRSLRPVAASAALALAATGLVILPATTATAAVTVPIGTVQGQMRNNVGTNSSGSSSVTEGNCLTYAPTTGAGASSTSTAWVTSPNEAAAGHGRGGSSCPGSLSTTSQSVIGVRPTSLTSVTTGTPFLLGQMTHYNNPIQANSQYFKGDLALQFYGETFSFPYLLNETPNNASPSTNPANDDTVTFTTQISESVTIGGMEFRLVVDGFVQGLGATCPAAPPANATINNNFRTTEGQNTPGCLYGELTQVRTLTLVKRAVASGAAPTSVPGFSFTSDSNLEGSPWDTDPGTLRPPSTVAGNNTASYGPQEVLAAAESVTISEAAPQVDWALTEVTCTDPGGQLPAGSVSVNLTTRTLTLSNIPEVTSAANRPITCTFTNTYAATSLKLVKNVTPASAGDPDSWRLSASAGAPNGGRNFSNLGGSGTFQQIYAGVSYTLAETPSPGTGFTSQGWLCTKQGETAQYPGQSAASVTVSRGDQVVCTVTNARDQGYLRISKVFNPGGSGFSGTFDVVYQCGSAAPVTVALAAGGSTVVGPFPTGTSCSVSEPVLPTPPTGWSFGTPGVAGSPATIVTSTLAQPGSSATVTNTITRNQHQVTLQKTWVNGVEDDSTVLTVRGGIDGPASDTSFANGDPGAWTDLENVVTSSVYTGATVTVSESLDQENTGSYTPSLLCIDGQGATVPDSGDGIFPMPDRNVTCTYTNTRTRNELRLQKVWVNGLAGDSALLMATGGVDDPASATSNAPDPADDQNSVVVDVLSGEPVTVSETVSGTGAYQSSLQCLVGEDEQVLQTTGSFEMPDEPVACTYTNTRISHEVTVQKAWVDGLEGDTAELTITGGSSGEGQSNPATSTAAGGDQVDTDNQAASAVLVGDRVTVSELLGQGNDGVYTSTLECTVVEGAAIATEEGAFTMPDAPVVCTYTNTRVQHTVKLQKAWVDARSGDTAALTVAGGLEGNTRTSTATGAPGTALDTTNVASAPVLVGDTVTVSEVLGSANLGTYASALVCTAGDGTIQVGANGSFAMPNADVTCTVTNARTVVAPPQPTVTAEVCNPNVPGAQLPGSITIPANPDYAYYIDGVATAAGTYPKPAGTYVVTAQLITTGRVAQSGQLSQLAVQPTYTWTIVVAGSPVCPVLDKTSTPPSGDTVVTGDLVTYTITVSNGGDTAVVGETLVDTLPAGAELVAGSVTPAGTYDASARTITWTFGLPAASGGSPATATFTYQVQVTADDGTLVNSVSWVQRNLTDSTSHPVEPGDIGGEEDTDEGEDEAVVEDTEDLASTGAGNEASLAVAGLAILVLGGGMVLFDRRRRRG